MIQLQLKRNQKERCQTYGKRHFNELLAINHELVFILKLKGGRQVDGTMSPMDLTAIVTLFSLCLYLPRKVRLERKNNICSKQTIKFTLF